jgi:predicted GNAT superfamily acetyltransferase
MSPSAPIAEVKLQLRELHSVGEMQACVELQQRVWGYSDLETVPDHVFLVAAKTGGHVLGAFDGNTMAGFALAFSASRNGRTYLHSHLVAVLPEYQNHGVGRALKIAQREDALNKGIESIEWTYDPLQIKNAYFNIARLGAIARQYLPDLYGRTSSPLHGGLPTDRLVAEWWVASPRVEAVIAGRQPAPRYGRRIFVSAEIGNLRTTDLPTAERMQSEVRSQFQQLFSAGYAVTGFEVEEQGGAYVLEPYKAGAL